MNQAHPLARFGNQYMHSTNSFVDDNEQKERIFEFSWMMIFNIIRERLIFHSSAYPCKSHSGNMHFIDATQFTILPNWYMLKRLFQLHEMEFCDET